MSIEPFDGERSWVPLEPRYDAMPNLNRVIDHSGDETDMDAIYALFQRPAWHALAACRGMASDHHADGNVFFPERGRPLHDAYKVCRTCPVTAECEQAGHGEQFGVWGGKSSRKRRTIRVRVAPCGTESGYQSHRYHDTKVCEACRDAHARYNARISAKRKHSDDIQAIQRRRRKARKESA